MDKAVAGVKCRSIAAVSSVSLFIFFLLYFSGMALAVPASPFETKFSQPDGATFTAGLKGDEWLSWVETSGGYAIEKGADGYWYYVSSFEGDRANLSHFRADEKPGSGIQPGLAPSGSNSGGAGVVPATTPTPFGSFNGKVLMILGEYDSKPHYYAESTFSNLLTQLSSYYNTVSHGKVTMSRAPESSGTSDGVIGWVRLGATHPNTGRNTSTVNQQIAKNAIIAADPYINFAQFDTDGDGYVDSRELSIVVVVAGYEGAAGCTSSVYGAKCEPSLWAHAWAIGASVGAPQVDGKYVGAYRNGLGYVEMGEIQDNHAATVGTPAHELGHLTFGLPDLYDTDGSTYGILDWCLMSYGAWGASFSDLWPGQMPVVPSAWVRQKLGWDTPITNSSSFSLTAAGSSQATGSNVSYRANTNVGSQYFLVENRQDLGYDRGLERLIGFTGFGGVAIYHVDETCSGNSNESCRLVDMETADNVETRGFFSGGELTDTWRAGTQTRFNAGSTPNSNLNNGSSSGVALTIIDGGNAINPALVETH